MDRRPRNAEADGRYDERDGDRGAGAHEYRNQPPMDPNLPQESSSGSNIVTGGSHERPHFGARYSDSRRYEESTNYGANTHYHYTDNRKAVYVQATPGIPPPPNASHHQITHGSFGDHAGGGQHPPYGHGQVPHTMPGWPDRLPDDYVPHQYVDPHPSVEPRQTVRKLTESIEAFVDQPISKKAHVYPGRQNMGLLKFRDVAIKVTQYTDRKMREAQNLVKLTPHANVVAVIHADLIQSFEKRLYIVMEMCNPLTLEDYIKKRKKRKIPFNPNEAVEFSKQLIEGMNHIHHNNIIHRDLKPSSVLFSMCGRFLKIIDFGMSKALKDGLSMLSLSTLPIGTDGFRAPETYNCNKIRKESDIFSLAILMYHVWSYGYHPFGEISLWSYNIKEHNPPVLTGLLVPDKETAIDLLQGMLKNEPEERSAITKVRTHPLNAQVVNTTLTKSSEALWTGSIQKSSDVHAKLDDCVIYKEKDVQGTGIDMRWKLELSCVPSINVNMLRIPVEKQPDGYLGIKQACSKCLRDYLKEKESQMGWVNIFDHQGKRTRTILIIRPPEYDELYGVLVRNPERLVSACESNLEDAQETAVKEPVGATGGQQPADEQQEVVDANIVDDMRKTNIERSSSAEQATASDESTATEEMPEEVTPHQAEARLSIPIGHLALIPWWIHDPYTP